jgi:hypothetical protein
MPVVVPASSPIATSITDATSFDGRIRVIDDPAYGGVRIKIDYSTELGVWAAPFQCTVYRRNADGSIHTVRGGDPYLNYAGKGWLYDQEAPLGQDVSYYAVPVKVDGSLGQPSAAAAIRTAAPAGGFNAPDMWLVNLENPAASVQARGTSTLGGSYNGRSDKQVILGSPYPVVTPDTRNGLSTSISLITVGPQEFAAMQQLLTQSVIMRKSSLWERPDGYFTVDDASYAAQASGTGREVYAWQLGLIEVSRPSTYGQTVSVPRFSFGDSTEQYPLFTDVPAQPFDAVQGGNMMDDYTADGETTSLPGTGWNSFNSNTSILRVSTISFKGTYSRRLTSASSGLMGGLALPRYGVQQGRTYTFSAWMYSATGLVADLQLDWLDGAGGYLTGDSLSEWGRTVTLTPLTWTKVSLSVTPAPGASLAACTVLVNATAPGQVAYFDTVSLENI